MLSYLRNYKYKNYRIKLVIYVMILTIIGILVIGSANEDYQSKQIIGLVIGLVAMVVVSLVDYDFILNFYWIYYGLAVLLLLVVLIFGTTVSGATRWIDVGIRFQPSELCKILLILFFARYLMIYEDEINKPKRLLITIGLAAVPLILILREPDLSTTIVTFLIIFTMMFLVGLSSKLVAIFFGVTIPSIGIVILIILRKGQSLLSEYQGLRILAWLRPEDYPESSYQQQNSIMAIGSGQFLGKGLYTDSVESVKNGNYISEPQTDFIFAVAGEELGFIGTVIIVLLLLAIVIECIVIGRKARDLSGKLICMGMASFIGYQSFVNICVVTGLMPNTGLPLPFLSYGLTSLVTLFIGMGLVLNVGLQSKKY